VRASLSRTFGSSSTQRILGRSVLARGHHHLLRGVASFRAPVRQKIFHTQPGDDFRIERRVV
jgi:hypothetical protein